MSFGRMSDGWPTPASPLLPPQQERRLGAIGSLLWERRPGAIGSLLWERRPGAIGSLLWEHRLGAIGPWIKLSASSVTPSPRGRSPCKRASP